MRHLTGATRYAFLLFFASHIPITLLVDGQAFLTRSLYPQPVLDVREWYATTFKDGLMTEPFAPWFRTLVACELLIQLPFFVWAVYVLWNAGSADGNEGRVDGVVDGKGKFRTACLIYGSHTVTTLIPILVETVTDDATTAAEKATLFGFYLPYLIFPAWLVFIAAGSEDVFGGAGGRVKAA